jgi:hypothetical protein
MTLSRNLQRSLAIAFITAGLGLTYRGFFYPPRIYGMGDADRFYHLAVSREMAQTGGLLRVLPQAEDLGWGNSFPDKEFLFHLFSALGYSLGGDWGALTLMPILAWGIVVGLFFLLMDSSIVGLPIWAALGMSLGGVLGSALFLFRLFLMRPFVLGIFFFIWIVGALLKRSPRMAFLGGVGFALGYHVYGLPLLAIGVFGNTLFLEKQNGIKSDNGRIALSRKDGVLISAPIMGMIAGTLFNPYFPGNFLLSWLNLKNALHAVAPLNYGTELTRLPLDDAIWNALGPIMVTLLAWRARWKGWLKPPRRLAFNFLTVMSTLLILLYLCIPRALEYLIPISILMAGAVIKVYLQQRPRFSTATAVSLCFFAPTLWGAVFIYIVGLNQKFWAPVDAIKAAIRFIPTADRGAKVFNCNWASGPIILYERPDLRFVDLLDPAQLYVANRPLHDLRQTLNDGKIKFPSRPIREVFHSRYVLCENSTLKYLLERDPHVRVLGPIMPYREPLPVAYRILEP